MRPLAVNESLLQKSRINNEFDCGKNSLSDIYLRQFVEKPFQKYLGAGFLKKIL